MAETFDPLFDVKELEEFSTWLFKQACDYKTSATSIKELPDYDLPEVAFAGRSNVGKSSLLNAVMGRKALARTSHTPGRTQMLNFFQLAENLMIVDLPGFGYARAPKDKVQAWTDLVLAYLRGRPTLKRVYLLIDSRHGLKKNDKEMLELLDSAAVSYQIVLTKLDKIPAEKLAECHKKVQEACASHPAAHPTVLVTSSHKAKGIEELRLSMTSLAAPKQHDGIEKK